MFRISSRVRGSRSLRLLLAALLVPVVVFANPQTAAAATPGPWSSVTVSDFGIGLSGVSCTFNMQHAGAGENSVTVGSNGTCYGQPDISPGFTQPGEAGQSYSLSVMGTTPQGTACSGSTSGTLGQHSANGTIQVAGTMSATSVSTWHPDCTVMEVCMTWPQRLTSDATGCADVNIAPPEPTVEPCPFGTPTGIKTWWEGPIQIGTYEDQWKFHVEVRGDLPPGTGTGTAFRGWNFNAIGDLFNAPLPTQFRNNHWIGGPPVANKRVWTVDVSRVRQADNSFAPGPKPNDPTYAGVEVYYLQPTDPRVQWNGSPNSYSISTNSYSVATKVPAGSGDGYGGITDPGRCRFYFGTKVVNLPDTDLDEPVGGIDEPEIVDPGQQPEPEVPPIEPIDPGEGFNWLAAIWAMLKAIFGLLGGLASAIVNGIVSALGALVDAVLDGLEALFVPSDGFLDGKVGQLEDAFDGSTLGNYMDALSGLVPPTASGCEGPAVRMSTKAPPAHPLSACGGAAATLADASRLVITISVGIGAALACVRILGRGLGWDPTSGGGAA